MTAASDSGDRWGDGARYDEYMGHWSQLVAGGFLQWIDAPPHLRWLDVGCGTGALSATIVSTMQPREVAAIDFSPEFAAAAAARLGGDVVVQAADAQDLPFDDGAFDCVVSGLMLNFVPDPSRAVSEMRRVAAAEGTVAAYLWDYAAGMELIRRFWDVAVALDPAAAQLDEAVRFPLAQPEPMVRLFAGAGLQDVATAAIDVRAEFGSLAELWQTLLGATGPAPSYLASLPSDKQLALAERFAADLVSEPAAAISMRARAWAVRGAVPG